MESVLWSVDGVWLGSYRNHVAGRFLPSFKASFYLSNDRQTFTGKIYDVGPGGDAVVEGCRDGSTVSFTACYLAPLTESQVCETRFEGFVSDDGDVITGHWEIRNGYFKSASGPWQAFRVNSRRAAEVGASWPPPRMRNYRNPLS